MTVAAILGFIRQLPLSSGRPSSCLPDRSVVYFILDKAETVRYVGATISLRKRWNARRRDLEIAGLRNFRVAWVNVHPDNLATVEDQLMRKLNPSYNRDRRHRYPSKPPTNGHNHK